MNRKFLVATLSMAMALSAAMPVCAAPATTTAVSQESTQVTVTDEDRDLLDDIFDAKYYAAMYPDVAAAVGNDEEALFEHFVTHGLAEGRVMSQSFNVNAYRSAYKDLNDAFGKDIMAYYRHYITTRFTENRAITTLETAQKHGIIVTNFSGQHVALDANGNMVTGTKADYVIATNPAYTYAIDLLGETPVSVKATSSITTSSTSVASVDSVSVQESKNYAVVPNAPSLVYDKAAYLSAVEDWYAKEPRLIDFCSKLNNYIGSIPNQDTYTDNVNKTAEQGQNNYRVDVDAWNRSEPVGYEYLTDAEKEAYNQAVADWNNAKPSQTDYVVGYTSEEAAQEAYNEAVEEWKNNETYPVREENEEDSDYTSRCEEWEETNADTKPSESDYQYVEGSYDTEEAAQEAYNEAESAWEAEEPDAEDYIVENKSEYDEAVKAWQDSEPDATRKRYCEVTDGYEDIATAAEAYQNAYDEWEAYWNEQIPELKEGKDIPVEDYLTEEEKQAYTEDHDAWKAEEPQKEDFAETNNSDEASNTDETSNDAEALG